MQQTNQWGGLVDWKLFEKEGKSKHDDDRELMPNGITQPQNSALQK